jgi:catechol 2,3-dioxygenase-like lactoylglutathione lyase family enzyme
VVLEAPDARALAAFYTELLEWPVIEDEPGWVVLTSPTGGVDLSFQSDPGFVRPVWPSIEGRQQMQAHLDLQVDDLPAAVASAVAAGATLAEHQPQRDVRVLLDPVGHPFCLYTGD